VTARSGELEQTLGRQEEEPRERIKKVRGGGRRKQKVRARGFRGALKRKTVKRRVGDGRFTQLKRFGSRAACLGEKQKGKRTRELISKGLLKSTLEKRDGGGRREADATSGSSSPRLPGNCPDRKSGGQVDL